MTTNRLGALRAGFPIDQRTGVGLAAGAALVSGISIFVNGAGVRAVPDAAIYTTLKNGVAAAILVALAMATADRVEVRALDRRSWAALAGIGLIGGSIPFLLFFAGLAQATAPAAAFIQKSLFVWVALLAVPLLGERLGPGQVVALGVLLVGQALVVNPAGVHWGTGEWMIAAATLLWAIESVVARRLLARSARPIPPIVLGPARLGFGLIVLVGYLAVTGRLPIVAALSPTQWGIGLATGSLLAVYVATWFAALRRAPASRVSAVLVAGAPITAALQAITTGALPAALPAAGLGLIVLGAVGMAGLGRGLGPRAAATIA